MGGKTKQAQRTKNNVRPASSGRSAELLSNPTKDPTIFGFGSGKPLPPLFPTFSAVNYEHGLNTEFSLCFKKFNKKDPITRAKALQEFLELTKNSNVDDVVAALPAWAHYYPMFTIDTDCKVRECAQASHAAIVKVSGRRVAPHLKKLLPVWLLAQHDDHAPAQHHAHSSITSTFPEGKLGDAMAFCKVEIVTLLLDNLMGNAEAMLNKKIENKEEVEIQVSQVVASSLRALEFFVSELPSSEDDWLWNSLTPLLKSGSFWKFIQNNNEQNFVRGAWYGCAGRLAERFGARFADEHGARTARALLAHGDASVTAHRWTALLRFVRALPEWWSWFEKQELLGKRIVEVIENGGWGDAGLLSSLVLPLLARMPPELLTARLFRDIFNAIFKGLERKSILNSKSERQAWITKLADCLRFLSIQKSDFVLEITTNVHRTWLEKLLAVKESTIRNNLIRHSAANMGTLFKFWLKSSSEEIKFDQILRNCWQNIGSTISNQIDKLSTKIDEINIAMENHILLLQSLKQALTQEAKKQHSIKFSDEPETKQEKVPIAKVECDVISSERYMHNLSETAYTACSLYFQFAYEKKVVEAVLTSLITLLIEFDSPSLYGALADHFKADSVYGLYERVLRAWLLDGAVRCRPLIDIVFLMLKHLTQQEQDAVFDSFEQLPETVVEWCLYLSTSHPRCGGAGGAGTWLRGGAAGRALRAVGRRAAEGADAHAAELLMRCLATDARGEWLTSKETVEAIVSQLTRSLSTVEDATLDRCARIAAQCVAAVSSPACPVPCDSLLRALIAMQMDIPRGDERLSLETWLEVASSWQDAIVTLAEGAKRSLEDDVVSIVHKKLLADMEKLDVKKIENIVALLPYVTTPSDYAEAPTDCTEIIDFTKRLFEFPSLDESDTFEYRALRCDCMTGDLNCPYDDENDNIKRIVKESSRNVYSELSTEDFMPRAYKCLFKALYLRAILFRTGRSDDEEDNSDVWCNSILVDGYFQEEFVQLLHTYMVINTLHERYAFWPHHENISVTKQRLEILISEVVEQASTEIRQKLLHLLSARSDTIGYYWAYAKAFYDAEIDKKTKAKNIDEEKSASSVYNDDESKIEYEDAVTEPTTVDNQENQENQERSDVAVSIEEDKTSEDGDDEAVKWEDILTGSGFYHSLQAQLRVGVGQESALQVRFYLALRGLQAAHEREEAVVGDEFVSEAAKCRAKCDADVFVDVYYRHNHTMLYDRDLSTAPWAQVVSNAAILDYLAELVAVRGWDLPAHHWDFITITLCSIINSIALSVNEWGCTKVALVSRSALALLARVQPFATSVRAESERRQPSEHLQALQREWDDIFAPDINTHLLKIFLKVVAYEEINLSSGHIASLGALVSGIPHLQWDKVPQVLRAEALSLDKLAKAAAEALQAPRHPAVKVLAFKALSALSEPLVLSDAELLAQWSAQQAQGEGEGGDEAEGEGEGAINDPPALSVQIFEAPLHYLQELVKDALSSISVCEETCELAPLSFSHSCALGYLLLAIALHDQCDLAREDLYYHYIEHFRKHKYAEYLMSLSLRLLPEEMLAYAVDSTSCTPLPRRHRHCFSDAPRITVEDACLSRSVGPLACRALLLALAGPGVASARVWWHGLPARKAKAARRLVVAYVARPLQRVQFQDVKKRAHLLPDTEVTVIRTTGEVQCGLDVDERVVELHVAYSEAHPLEPPKATPTYNPTLPDVHWLNVYFAHQNGRLVKALRMWCSAVRARIESAAQCYVCYCRQHPRTGRLPTALCFSCKNKFHTNCLKKWFATSLKSKCPLCRANF